jgi:hypothetical protein
MGPPVGDGRAFRFEIAYNRGVQTAAAWSRSPPHRNHAGRIAIGGAARGYRGGHAAAVAADKFGRKPKLTLHHQKREAIRRRDRDGEPVREIARS